MSAGKILITILAILTATASAGAQTVPAEQSADTSDRDFVGLTITPEELEVFIKEARIRRLSMERDQVAGEIRSGMLFDVNEIESALKVLSDNPQNTCEDNAKRICQAFAMVDKRFGKAWALLDKGDHKGAIASVKPFISERDTSYFAAAKRFCLAEAMVGSQLSEDAVEAYTDLVKAMPEKFSFAALSLLRAGRTYEKLDRYYYAMTLYKLWVESYGIWDTETSKELADRAEKIAADYKDPLKTIAGKMSEVEKRLTDTDSGRTTQARQKEIVSMLSDLIATAEENASQGQSESKGEGKKGKGKGESKGGKQGPASGIGIPSKGATVSRLTGGATLAPSGLREIHTSDQTDDWGKLPPKEQKKLMETFRETMPERYRGMTRDYYKRMASERSDSE